LLEHAQLTKAVSELDERAERTTEDILRRTFVDTGAIVQLNNNTNQIVYGRRGSGKTHVLRVLSEGAHPPTVAIYIDCRTLTSSGRTLADAPVRTRALAVFKDIVHELADVLLTSIVELVATEERSGRAFEALGNFTDELFALRYGPAVRREVVAESATTHEIHTRGEVRISAIPQVEAAIGGKDNQEAIEAVTTSEAIDERVSFGHFNFLLSKVLAEARIDSLIILIDEWAELEPDEQPYVAEYLKRAFFANSKVVIKIAALEYRSRFSIQDTGRTIGLETGGDIFANTDLDDYFLPDRNPDEVHKAYARLLARHLDTRMEGGEMTELGVTEENIQSRLFTQAPVFHELVRASEGVPRDFINIFKSAFFDAKRRGRSTIDMEAIHTGSRQWYESDKRQNLSERQERLLRRLVDEVIGKRRARCFMLQQDHSRHPMIRQLYDLRVIHRLRAGYSGRDRPGVRYDVFALDYGTYVDLRNTSAMPLPDFVLDETVEDADEFAVPFNDHRSIRRIILDPSILDQA
jgi:hypothetical protein